jgi:hypothetical protein
MLQRGLDYAAATVIICAICAALLVLAAEILSFSSPLADTAAALGTAVLLNSLRRRIRTRAKHRSGPKTEITSGGISPRISARVLRQATRHQGCRLGQQQRGSCPGARSGAGRIAADRTLVTGARATRCGSRTADKTPASPARCPMEPAILTGHHPDAAVSTSPNRVVFKAAAAALCAVADTERDMADQLPHRLCPVARETGVRRRSRICPERIDRPYACS